MQSNRRGAVQEPPHCPVCRARYGGDERHPGPKALARQLAKGFARQVALTASEALRFVLLGTLLVQYRAAASAGGGPEDDGDEPLKPSARFSEVAVLARTGGRALAALALALFLIHKNAVLAASLPAPRPPPETRLLRRFYTADLWCIARHVAELLAAVVLLGTRCYCGELPLSCFVPVALASLAPAVHLLLWYPVTACLKEVGLFLAFLVCAPPLALLEIGRLVWRHRLRLLNPLDGPVHVILSLTATVLCLACRSRRPVLMLFAGHSVVIVIGLIERTCIRRLPWRSGHAWWCALLISIEAASLACERRWVTLLLLLVALRSLQRAAARPRAQPLFQGPLWWCTLLVVAEATSLALREVRGNATSCAHSGSVVPTELVVVVWLGLFCALTCAVNWGRCMRHYRGWQRRHATFVLCVRGLRSGVDGAATAPPAGGAEDEELVDAEEWQAEAV